MLILVISLFPRIARWLIKATVTILFEVFDPLIGCLPGDARAFSKFGYGGLIQLIIFDESLSLFRHGNTFPRHVFHLLHEISVTHVFGICVSCVFRFFVTYVFEWFIYYSPFACVSCSKFSDILIPFPNTTF
jgi:hypothetical protein